MNQLFESDSDSGTESKITTNKEYAKSFNQLRQKEMLQKFKDKRLSDLDSDDLSTSSSEDDDEALNPEFTKTFLKTLASLKSKNPKIYDKNVKFFEKPVGQEESEKKIKNKKMNLENYERKMLLETKGKLEESDDEHFESKHRSNSPTLVEEERLLKQEFKKVLEDSDDENEEDSENFGKIFKKRDKSKEELENEESQYTKWLVGQNAELKPLKEFWSNPKLSKDETFLRDYILNNGYVDDDDMDLNVQTEETIKISDDEKEVEEQEVFEHKYNFRYEEPDQDFIKRYPRTIDQSVRKTDDKRSIKRLQVKERKEKEKELKLKELQEIKKIKKQEIEDKIKKLKEVTGNDKLAFDDVDFEDDFDPEEHDRKMKQIFDEEYYQYDEGEQKPECPNYEELLVENWDNYDPKSSTSFIEYNLSEGLHCEDENFNMDADYNPDNDRKNFENELIENSKTKKKRRNRKSQFMQLIEQEKPAFDPEDEKTYGEYIEEYYKLDYEDMIGDIPCRFRYVETVPNDFGLSVEEILLAKNNELNQWASLKKAVQLRPMHVEKNEVNIYKRRATNLELKKKIFQSIYGDQDDEEIEESKDNQNVSETVVEEEPKHKVKKKKKKRKLNETENISEPQTKKKMKLNPTKSSSSQEKTPNLKSSTTPDEKKKNGNLTPKSDPMKPNKTKTPNAVSRSANTKRETLDAQKSKKQFNVELLFKKKTNKPNQQNKNKSEISDNRLRAFGLNPSKFHYKQKIANQQNKSKTMDGKVKKNRNKKMKKNNRNKEKVME